MTLGTNNGNIRYPNVGNFTEALLHNRPVLRELRQQFPNLTILTFARLHDVAAGDNRKFQEMLMSANKAAIRHNRRSARKVVVDAEAVRQRIVLAQTHHGLGISVPSDVDLQHAQAIIVYGYLMPGNTRVFAGGKCLPDSKVRVNVESKLCDAFDNKKFTTAFAYLVSCSVVLQKVNPGKDAASSLNPHEKTHGVTEEGRRIISQVKQFLFSS